MTEPYPKPLLERNAWLEEAFPSSAPFRNIDLTQFTRVTWNDGTPLPLPSLIELLQSDDPGFISDRENLLRDIDSNSVNLFLKKAIPLLGSAKRDLDDSIYSLIESWGDRDSLKMLGDFTKSQLQTRKHTRILDALSALSRCRNSESAVAELDYFRIHATTPAVKESTMSALASQLDGRDVSFREISDRNAATLGFDASGPKTIQLGSQNLAARVLADLSLELRNEKGKVIKSIPAARKGDDAALRNQAAEWLSSTRKELKQFASDHAARLEEAMVADLTWPASQWRSRYLDRPLLAQLGRRILWTAKRNSVEPGDVFRIAEDYTLANEEDDNFHLDDNMNVSIAYPLGWLDAQRNTWKTIIEDYSITPLFSQFDRAVFVPSEEEYRSNSIHRFFGIQIDHRSLKNRFKRSGWEIGRFRDSFPWSMFHFRDFMPNEDRLRSMPGKSLEERTIRAICFHDRVFANTDYSQDLALSLAHVAFARASEIDLKDARKTIDRLETGDCFLPIIDVPPRIFSESLRDISRLVGTQAS